MSAYRVGIGTTSPLSSLDIAQHDGASHTDFGYDGLTLSAHASASEPSIITFRSANEDGNLANSAKIGSVTAGTGSTYNGNLVFSTRAGASIAERMRVTHEGRLGIGETAPSTKLHVKDSSAGAGVVLTIENNGASGAAQIDLKNDVQSWFVNTRTDDHFSIYNNTSASTPFLIKTDGNVGIGVTDPDH